ncbi:MAG: hypothetical protein ABRQ39_32070, partial [Candidatus Eremiobacterota bacterium]
MKQLNLILTLILLIIFALFLSIGCGSGGDTIATSPSLTNTVNNNTNSDSNEGAYLKIKITWPERETGENTIISSGNKENVITTSMYPYTTKVVITVRPYYDPNDPNAPPDNPNSYLPNGRKEINWSPSTTQQEIKLGPLPTFKVKVRAESYIETFLIAVSETQPIQLEFGVTPFELDLGLPNIYVKVAPIYLEGIQEEPDELLPLKESETYIKTRIVLESPDLLPKPTPTPSLGKENNIISQESVGVEYIKARYTIVGGYGALTTDGINYSQSVTVNSDYNGVFKKVKLRADTHLDMYIRYDYFLDRNNPDTISYTDIQDTEVFGLYAWQVVANPSQIKINESST